MEAWQVGLVIVMAVGVGAIVAGALIDRTRGRARERAISAPPVRPGLDPSLRPAYVSDADAGRTPEQPESLPAAERAALEARVALTSPIDTRLASKAFLTDRAWGRAVSRDASVLVCGDPVETVREVMGLVGAYDPLVIVAPAYADEVRRTLEVNRIQRLRQVVAIVADDDTRTTLAQITGATALTRRDLQSGWAPPTAMGRAALWVASLDRSWVTPSTAD